MVEVKIEIKNDLEYPVLTTTPQNIQEKLLQEKFKEYQDWGYYNGLAMPKRILGENEWFESMGWEYNKNLTCEKIIDDMYELGQKNVRRPD